MAATSHPSTLTEASRTRWMTARTVRPRHPSSGVASVPYSLILFRRVL